MHCERLLSGAYDWEAFTLDGTAYLAVANAWGGTSHTLNSTIFKWNNDSLLFEQFQSMQTNVRVLCMK